MRFHLRTPLLLACALLFSVAARAEDVPATVKPVPREGGWMDRHNSFNERVKQGDVDLLFIGDSITQGWEGAGKDVWAKHYGPRKAVNLGISGDQTQHVLWRLENGNITGIKPKLAVLMIGTNNSGGADTAEDIAAGIQAIVKKLRKDLPETKVLILAIFPRGDKPNPQREKNAKASQIASQLADNENVYYLDIGPKFLEADGTTLSREIMPDLLHLNPKSYGIWAESIEPTVAKLMGEK